MLVACIGVFGFFDLLRTYAGNSLLNTQAITFAALACYLLGLALWRRWAKHQRELMLETDEVLIRPLVELLVPGATFSRPIMILSGWHPSLLIPEEEGSSGSKPGQVVGHLFGQAIVISELDSPSSWLTRVDLPFAIASHLRICNKARLGSGTLWRTGFEQHSASQRLGNAGSIQLAPLGTGPDKIVVTPNQKVVPVEHLLSDALLEQFRANPELMIAVVGSTLWLLLPRAIRAFESRVASPSDQYVCKKAAAAMRDIENVTHAILAAGLASQAFGQDRA